MKKSELVNVLAKKQVHLSTDDIRQAVDLIVDSIAMTLESKGNVEIRGFGSFSLRFRRANKGRNPKTGESLMVPSKYLPFFKPGKELRERLKDS